MLKPIVRVEKKLVNSWAGTINYLLDLKTKKQSIINQLQNECIAIYQNVDGGQSREAEVK